MSLAIQELLRPLTEAAPCGPDLRELKEFESLRDLSASEDRVDWGRALPSAIALAQETRDLRAWVWLARAALAAEGLPGLADGLELIAGGLDRYWDHLPPIDRDETDPRERYLGRLMALTALGGSSFQTTPADLRKRRDIYHLAGELDTVLARTGSSPEGSALAQRIATALDAIEGRFREGFGAGHDPQLGFELLRDKVVIVSGSNAQAVGAGLDGATPATPTATTAAVSSRADVMRVLDLVLEYYERQEPASPVPLLVARAKRLVPMTFVEAMRDLAPAGMKELQAVAGSSEPT
jgi:type VI secretion system protein ImpA